MGNCLGQPEESAPSIQTTESTTTAEESTTTLAPPAFGTAEESLTTLAAPIQTPAFSTTHGGTSSVTHSDSSSPAPAPPVTSEESITTLDAPIQTPAFSTTHGGTSSVTHSDSSSPAPAPPVTSGKKTTGFRFHELEEITDAFADENVLGRGGFGTVFKGNIKIGNNNQEVAVKRMVGSKEIEFVTETMVLSRVRDPTIIEMIGFCAYEQDRLIVYELMAGGNLESFLRGSIAKEQPLSWIQRMRVGRDVARALSLLHNHNPSIIHGHVNVSNILLNKDFEAKLSDFGRAMFGPLEYNNTVEVEPMSSDTDDQHYSPRHASGRLSFDSDVYGYGIVLLQLLTGLKPTALRRHMDRGNVLSWVDGHPWSGDDDADKNLKGDYPIEDFRAVLSLALSCAKRKERCPTMMEVYSDMKTFASENRNRENV